jgi:biopolymer transport protein ExbD
MHLVSRRRSRRSLISLTPLIDIVFILLVFFMLASSYLEWRSLDLMTATRGAAAAADPERVLRLRLRSDGRAELAGAVLADAALADRLAAAAARRPDRRVVVEPNPGVPLQRMVDVLAVVEGAGLSAVSLVRPAGD